MSTARSVWIVCDVCGERCPCDTGASTRRDAAHEAKKCGWRLRISRPGTSSIDLCSDCELDDIRLRDQPEPWVWRWWTKAS